jgi:N-carbamoyl-L-amino-acid hydrolase
MKGLDVKSRTATLGSDEAEIAAGLFAGLARFSGPGPGVTRPAFSELETAALQFLAAAIEEWGFTARIEAGALFVDLSGATRAPALWLGSHVDSVPHGGRYDGAAGVVAALLVLRRLHESGIAGPPVRAVALRGEESPWFGEPYLGSRILLGQLPTPLLAHRRRGDGVLLADALAGAGIDVDRVAAGRPLIDPRGIAGWLELHIEQGPLLVAREHSVAVVSALRGHVRFQAGHCLGEAGHSGAVPHDLRRDPVPAVAELVMRLEEWRDGAAGGDAVVTIGMIGTDAAHHAATRIADSVSFSLECRSARPEVLRAFTEAVARIASEIGERRGVAFALGECAATTPQRLSEQWCRALQRAARETGHAAETMLSGAGHDAGVFAAAGIPAGMAFVRSRNGSHNPQEHMDMGDFLAGVDCLHRAVQDWRANAA